MDAPKTSSSKKISTVFALNPAPQVQPAFSMICPSAHSRLFICIRSLSLHLHFLDFSPPAINRLCTKILVCAAPFHRLKFNFKKFLDSTTLKRYNCNKLNTKSYDEDRACNEFYRESGNGGIPIKNCKDSIPSELETPTVQYLVDVSHVCYVSA